MEQHDDEVMKFQRVAWTREEEEKLREYVMTHGPHHWDTIASNLDIRRSGNSCRLKWFQHLKPGIKRGKFTHQEILLILTLRFQGKGWSKIAKELPGRTDNHIKNFWNSTWMKKEAQQLNCHDLNTQQFLNKMTETLTHRIIQEQEAAAAAAPHHAYSMEAFVGSSTGAAQEMMRNADEDRFVDESIWDIINLDDFLIIPMDIYDL